MQSNLILQITLPIVIIILLYFSAFSSFSEMSIASSNIIKLKKYASNNSKREKKLDRILKLKLNPNESFVTIITLNNICNILNSSLATIWFGTFIGDSYVYIVSFIFTTLLVIIFAELLPKFFALKIPEKGAFFSLVQLEIFIFILKPITFLITNFTKSNENKVLDTIEELKFALIETKDHGVTTNYEYDALQRILSLNEKRVEDLMIKFKELTIINLPIKFDELQKLIFNNKLSRFPIVNNEKIVGILNAKDFVYENFLNKKISEKKILEYNDLLNWISSVRYVENSTYLYETLNILRLNREKIALIHNSNKKVIGLITTQDITRYIFGNIDGNIKNANFSSNASSHEEQNLFTGSTLLSVILKEKFSKINPPKVENFDILTIENWAKKFVLPKKLENNFSFSYESLIFWVKIIDGKLYFQIDCI